MINIKTDTTASSASTTSALSFLSKGWREVRDSAESDLQLMKTRANSFKNLATTFDKEIENFINSAPTFSVPTIKYSSSTPPAEIDFVKKLQPKLTEFRRAYSSPDFSKKVLEKWGTRASIRINLSAIKNAIVSEDYEGVRFQEFWKEERDTTSKDWEPIRALKTRLKEFEKKEIFEGLKNNEFMEKLKSSLVLPQLINF